VRIVGVEPYLQHHIQGLKNMKESYRPGIYDKGRLDEKVNIQDEDAFAMARRLAREEGLLVGMSSGAAMHVAIEKARELDSGVVVVILPDSGERYLSTRPLRDRPNDVGAMIDMAGPGERSLPVPKPAEVLTIPAPMSTRSPTSATSGAMWSRPAAPFPRISGDRVRHVMNIIDLADRSIRVPRRQTT
jgi:cysteinyl-tRNA synthetase